jgi:hypothetical protein
MISVKAQVINAQKLDKQLTGTTRDAYFLLPAHSKTL